MRWRVLGATLPLLAANYGGGRRPWGVLASSLFALRILDVECMASGLPERLEQEIPLLAVTA